MGFAGIFVPLLPATGFMLLVLPCFARSSPRLEAWLLNHSSLRSGAQNLAQCRARRRS
nr:DUF454 family protein [Altericroceibacterium spongiae]